MVLRHNGTTKQKRRIRIITAMAVAVFQLFPLTACAYIGDAMPLPKVAAETEALGIAALADTILPLPAEDALPAAAVSLSAYQDAGLADIVRMTFEEESAVAISTNLAANAKVRTAMFPDDAAHLTDGDLAPVWRTQYQPYLATYIYISFAKPTSVNKLVMQGVSNMTAYQLFSSADGAPDKLLAVSGTNDRQHFSQVFQTEQVTELTLIIYGVSKNAAISIGELSIEYVKGAAITKPVVTTITDDFDWGRNLLQKALRVSTKMGMLETEKLYDGAIYDPWRTKYVTNIKEEIMIDFGTFREFNKYAIIGLRGAVSYTIEYSTNGSSYTSLTQCDNPAVNTMELIRPVSARYIRLTITGVPQNSAIFIGQLSFENVTNTEKERAAIERFLNPDATRESDLRTRFASNLVMVLGCSNVLLNGNIASLSASADGAPPVERDGTVFVPAAFVAAKMGASVTNGDDLALTLKTTKVVISLSQNTVYRNGEPMQANVPVLFVDGQLMLPLYLLCDALGVQAYANKLGMIVIGSKVESSSFFAQNSVLLDQLSNILVFERPTPETILRDIERTGTSQQHPRLYNIQAQTDAIHSRAASDPVYAAIRKSVLETAKTTLNSTITVGQQFGDDISYLTAAYALTKHAAYKNKVWEALDAASRRNSWGNNSLEISSVALGFALAYDWLYDEWTDVQRTIISTALRDKCLSLYLDVYNGASGTVASDIAGTNNINAVGNAAAVIGALAIFETDPAFAAEVISKALRTMEAALVNFQPEGAWMEGTSYWQITMSAVAQMLSALEHTAGTDYGILELPGFSQAGYFILYTTGPNGRFNFNDSWESPSDVPPELLYLAGAFADSTLGGMRRQALLRTGRGTFGDFLWYDPAYADASAAIPLDATFARTESGSFSGAQGDANAMYLAFKGGINGETHGNLNAGTFVLDAGGERWIVQPNHEKYDMPGYFTTGIGAQRWTYYRNRAEGNNCLLVNPGKAEDMRFGSYAPIVRFESASDTAFSVIDTTMVHENVLSAKRGFMLTDNRTRAVIQDSIQLTANGEIWWFAHTRANITIAADGRSAILEQNGKKLSVTLHDDQNLQLTVMPASPLPSSPNPSQSRNDGLQKLAIHGTGASSYAVSVSFTLINSAKDSASWSAPNQNWLFE